jgi:xanthine dehydrogenase accessory factor
LIKGAGEHASGSAHRLFHCGFRVVMTEVAAPTAVRRRVAFSQAVYDGTCTVEGVTGRLWRPAEVPFRQGFSWDHIPIFVDPGGSLIPLLRPAVVLDARLLKRDQGVQIHEAPLVIGLGPGFMAGRDVHVVVETHRGHDLGRVIRAGSAAADTGTPGEIGGHGAERVLRAPVGGNVEVLRDIGSLVAPGDLLARVGGAQVRSPIAGVVRGMIQPGSLVPAGLKIGDVDPRGDVAACATLSDKTRTISGGVLEAILAWQAGAR